MIFFYYRHMTVLPCVFVIWSRSLVKVRRIFFLSEFFIRFYFISFPFHFIQFDILFFYLNFISFNYILLNFTLFNFNNFFYFSYDILFFWLFFNYFYFFQFIQFNSIADCGKAQLSLPLFVSTSPSTVWRWQTATLTLVPILHCQLSPDSNRLKCLIWCLYTSSIPDWVVGTVYFVYTHLLYTDCDYTVVVWPVRALTSVYYYC